MTTISDDKLILVEVRHGGLQTESFKTRLQMIMAIMDNGALGGGVCYGDDKHQLAITAIEQHVAKVRENIKRDQDEEASLIASEASS